MSIEYIKLNMKSSGYKNALTACDVALKKEYPNNILSVTPNADKTYAWVKTCAGHGVTGAVVTDSCTYESRGKVLSDVYSPTWLPVDVQIGGIKIL